MIRSVCRALCEAAKTIPESVSRSFPSPSPSRLPGMSSGLLLSPFHAPVSVSPFGLSSSARRFIGSVGRSNRPSKYKSWHSHQLLKKFKKRKKFVKKNKETWVRVK
mmetsp:Transcript_27574/g.54116  ORF Transcript_27574/g.54116 Transcript_27574/m.54116 type:complete len:106 (+) Transcript_27574:200-517(+)